MHVQFVFDSSSVGKSTGEWLCVTLGVWHPYKQANTVVWSHWGPRFLGPFFNHMVPGSDFRSKARLITIITFFTYIRLAAPSFAVELQQAIQAARKLPAKPLILAYLLDLRSLIFFAIPVVRNDSRCININDNGFLLWCERGSTLFNSQCTGHHALTRSRRININGVCALSRVRSGIMAA